MTFEEMSAAIKEDSFSMGFHEGLGLEAYLQDNEVEVIHPYDYKPVQTYPNTGWDVCNIGQ